jgi:hypothetical protein
MKKWIPIFVAAGALALTACKEKKQSDDIIISKQEVRKPSGPVSMQDYADTKNVDWMGGKYEVAISRQSSGSLPMVTDDDGQKYVDNRISLKISRQDGSVFYEKEWTKDDSASYLDESYKKGGILEAMIFDHVQGTEMRFAVSVCKPESGDEFIPLVLTVNSTKGIAIRRDSSIDTNGESVEASDDEI